MRGLTSNTEGFTFNRVKWHILFWIAYIFFYTLTPIALGDDTTIKEDLLYVLLLIPLKIFATYTLVYYFIPQYLLKRRYFIFFMIMIPLVFILGFGQRLILGVIFYPVYYPEHLAKYGLIYLPKVFYAAIDTYFVATVAAVIKLLKQWFNTQQLTNSLKQEKLAAELKFLKAQIHPHFLFNTLNNLYALTLKKSSKAPEVVLKLSELLDYMLYECNVPKVTLEKEINMLENYIALEKIRYGDDLKVNFNIDDGVKGFLISPMLLLPLVENSFKHGVSSEIHEKWIEINLNANDDILEFSIENSRDSNSVGKKESYTEGIGLKNVVRRLELVYKNKHQLKIDDNGDSFKVLLTINTKDE
ncbi:sensor histidine kinase [Bacteroidota bacterium]